MKDYEKLADLKKFAEDSQFRARSSGRSSEQIRSMLSKWLARRSPTSQSTRLQCWMHNASAFMNTSASTWPRSTSFPSMTEFGAASSRTSCRGRFSFAGKAAPAYRMAKLIVRLIHGVAQVIAADQVARKYLSVVFLPGLQREECAAHLSRRRSIRTDINRGNGGIWHWQYEVCDEWRAHDWNARWRERGDSRGGRARTTSSSSA